MKKAFSKSVSWLLSVVMIFGIAFMPASSSSNMGNLSVNATDNYFMFSDSKTFFPNNKRFYFSGYYGSSMVWYELSENSSILTLGGKGYLIKGMLSKFQYCGIKKVIISGDIGDIGENAFEGFKNLESVQFTGTTESIPDYTFSECTSLSFVDCGNVKNIGKKAFGNCSSLVSVVNTNNVTDIGAWAFKDCTSLEEVYFPSVITIDSLAFANCSSLAKADIGSNVTSIGSSAFAGCTKLSSITIPKSVTNMGSYVFNISNDFKNYKYDENDYIVINGYSGSTAEAYAKRYNITFHYWDKEATDLIINKTYLALLKDESETLETTILPSDVVKVVAWNSSNPRVAKVEDGKVTAISFGEAVITATTSNGLTAECNVLVSKIRLDKTSITLDRRASDTLTAIMLPLDTDDPIIYEPNTTKKKKNQTSNPTDNKVIWKSSNPKVATVEDGKVTAISLGEAVITANISKSSLTTGKFESYTATCVVRVKDFFNWGTDNWRFNNTRSYFSSYDVNDKVMEKMQVDFGLTDYEIERLKIHIAKRNKEGWKGSCFGMTVSAILAKQGDLKLSNYGCDDVVYQNNPFTSNAMSVINFIHGIRGLYNYQKWLRQSLYMPKSFDQYDYINKIEEVLQNENRLVELEYGIKKYNKYSEKYDTYGYHAVIMYGIEDCNYYSSVTGKRYDKKILIADPNYMSGRNVDDNACMYYRSSDHSWIIPYWNKDYSSCTYLCYWNSNSTLSTKTGDISNIIVYDSLVENEDLMADSTLDHYIAGIEIDNISKNKTYIQQVKNTGESNLNYSADLNSNIGEYNIAMNDILIDDIEMDDIDGRVCSCRIR